MSCSCPLSVAVGNTVSRAVREISQCLEKAPTYLLELGLLVVMPTSAFTIKNHIK